MAPVIRIDEQVMGELKKHAIDMNMVFATPNDVLRKIFGIDSNHIDPAESIIDIQINRLYTPRRWSLIPIRKHQRAFFPGYKVPFELITDTGVLITHVTSAVTKRTPIGDPKEGKYIQGGLRPWYDKHPELKDGAKFRIEVVEPGKRYKLSIVQAEYMR